MSCTRREFLALAGAGVLCACGTPLPSVTPVGSQVVLDYQRFPSLASPGGSAIVDVQNRAPIAVVRTTSDAAVALSATCTHAACILGYAQSQMLLHCDCHGADFTLSGAVVRGPTQIPLPVYAATVSDAAVTVQLD